jgi:NAD(P)-dependent dehydrogenase (short-subunit alcohol dehydrogenase family)
LNHYDLAGQVAIITGGARGIGYAVAQRLLAGNASVVLWDLAPDLLAEAAASLASGVKGGEKGGQDPPAGHRRVRAATVDVTDPAAIAAATADVLSAFGRIDVLVNSAGITGPNHPLWEYPAADFERVMRINLLGTFNCCQAVVPAMLSRGYGRIVNLASLAGKEGTPNASAYSASKAAVMALTKSLGKELATSGIVVNSVAPAAARTEMLAQMTPEHVATMLAKSPVGRLVEAEEIAALVAWMASDECSFTTGYPFDISGGRAAY